MVAPLAGVALAVMVMLAGVVNVAFWAGEVMLTVGGVGASTVMVIGADSVLAPSKLVASAMTEYVPAGTLVQL